MNRMIRPELYPGPLDVVRQVCSVVGRFDLQLATEEPLSPDELFDTWRMIKILEGQMPIIGDEVSVIGELLSVEDDGLLVPNKPSLKISRDEQGSTEDIITGTYKGFEVMPVFDEGVGVRTRVLHSVEPGNEKFLTPKGDEVTYGYRQYAVVGDSGIMPREPINAHSTEDLENDEATRNIDEIVEDTADETVRILRVGAYINELMAGSNSNRRRDFQIVSYVNSLNLTPGKRVGTNDWIEGSPRTGGDFSWCQMSPRREFIGVLAGQFAILPAYKRSSSKPMTVDVLDHPELYLRARRFGGDGLTIPVKSIAEIKEL